MEAWRSGFSKGCWSTAVPLLTQSGFLMEAITRDIASLACTPLGHRPVFATRFWQTTGPSIGAKSRDRYDILRIASNFILIVT